MYYNQLLKHLELLKTAYMVFQEVEEGPSGPFLSDALVILAKDRHVGITLKHGNWVTYPVEFDGQEIDPVDAFLVHSIYDYAHEPVDVQPQQISLDEFCKLVDEDHTSDVKHLRVDTETLKLTDNMVFGQFHGKEIVFIRR